MESLSKFSNSAVARASVAVYRHIDLDKRYLNITAMQKDVDKSTMGFSEDTDLRHFGVIEFSESKFKSDIIEIMSKAVTEKDSATMTIADVREMAEASTMIANIFLTEHIGMTPVDSIERGDGTSKLYKIGLGSVNALSTEKAKDRLVDTFNNRSNNFGAKITASLKDSRKIISDANWTPESLSVSELESVEPAKTNSAVKKQNQQKEKFTEQLGYGS